MLTKYEEKLIAYWKDWKPGMPNFGEVEVPDTRPEVKVEVTGLRDLAEDIGDEIWDIL